MGKYRVSYAQNREDIVLEAFFPDVKKGFYVDVGAYHPTDDSVTKLFYDRGWRGINIEPNPMLINLFARTRKRDINLNIGVSSQRGKLSFREYENKGLSTFSEEMKKRRTFTDPNLKYKDYIVEVLPLKEVFKRYSVKHIHFMKIDVEGHEYEVLQGNDWDKFRPEVICIEADHLFQNWGPLLKGQKYTLIYKDGLNEYYVANECRNRSNIFSVEKVFKPLIVSAYSDKLIRAVDQENKKLKLHARELEQKLDNLRGIKKLSRALTKEVSSRILRRSK